MKFTKSNRKRIFEQTKDKVFDVLIIGGGITGAGIALDASSRGISTILFDKGDFAEGTSSKSTKLVHGGLRYLKNFEIKLVRDAGKERAILYQNAPHIVYPQKMILPIYKQNKYGKFLTSIGLWMYDLLAGVESKYKKRVLSKERILKLLPLLKQEDLEGGVAYYEYRTKDSRLVIENIKKSIEYGAICLNYAKVINIKSPQPNKNIVSVKIQDELSKNEYSIKAKVVINATGVWTDLLLKKNSITNHKYVLPSKGTHILVDKTKTPINSPVYFELEDDRMVFAIPTGDKVYIGTTDEIYTGNLDEVYAKKYEIKYLIQAFNQFFTAQLKPSDVEITWAGIRPLVMANTNNIHKISRKEEIIVHNKNTISILGGKLTAYRLMAEKVTNKLVKMLPDSEKYKKCFTREINLSGAEFNFGKVESHKIIEYAEQKFYEAYQLNANTELINDLFYTYGKNIELIIEKAFEIYNSIDDRSLAWLDAEIWYTVNNEMVINLSDFMIRRTDRFYFSHKESLQKIHSIAQILGKYLKWSNSEEQRQVLEYKNIAKKNHSFIK